MIPEFQLVTSPQTISLSPDISIQPPLNMKKQGIDIQPELRQVFPSSFVMIILGKPGSGKSHLVGQLLQKEVFFAKRFDRILYVGPSCYEGIIQDEGNWHKTLNIEWIIEKCKQAQGWASNILVVFDDVVSQLPSTLRNEIQNFFYVRRHIVKQGTVSIIFTTQKYTALPSWMRLVSNVLITFGINQIEMRKIKEQQHLGKEADGFGRKCMQLGKHEFIICNLNAGKVFDYKFKQI